VECQECSGNRRIGDMVHMMAGLNEIPVTDYVSLEKEGKQNPDATFRNDSQFKDKSVLKNIEDSELVSAGLRSHAPNDTGFGPPAMDLFFRITKKLQEPHSVPEGYLKAHPGFAGDTLLDVVFVELGKLISSKRQLTADCHLHRPHFRNTVCSHGRPKEFFGYKTGSGCSRCSASRRRRQFAATFRKDLGQLPGC